MIKKYKYGIKVKDEFHLLAVIILLHQHDKEYVTNWKELDYDEDLYIVFNDSIEEASYAYDIKAFNIEVSTSKLNKMLLYYNN